MAVYEFGRFRVEAEKRLLLCDGRPVPLPGKPFDVLVALLNHAGQVAEKEALMRAVWPGTAVEENNLTQAVSTLRRALGEDGEEQKYIATIPRRGYQFVATVREPESQPAARRGRGCRWLAAGVGAVAFAAAALYWGLSGRWHTPNPGGLSTLAVLPFQVVGGPQTEEYFGLGMADALITKLSNLPHVTVRPTSAVLRYWRSQDKGARAAGRELEVAAVLEGTIQSSGDRIRVSVQLVRVGDGRPIWAERFDAAYTDLFSLEDSISEQVARALAIELSSRERQGLSRRYTDQTEAHQAYLKGRFHYWNRAGLRRAVEAFEQAVKKDPRFAAAYAALGECYSLLSLYGGEPAREAGPKAKAAAATAVALDDALPEAHAALAFTQYIFDWDFGAAERELRRAIALNPKQASVHQLYSRFLVSMGRSEEALKEARLALSLDPWSPTARATLGYAACHARQYEAAIAELRYALELDPAFDTAHALLGMAYRQKGMYQEAIVQFRQGLTLLGQTEDASAQVGIVYGLMGKKQQARKILAAALGKKKPSFDIAVLHTGLGEKDEALRWLEKAYQERFPWLVNLNADPRWDSLRSDTRFQELVRRVGLPGLP